MLKLLADQFRSMGIADESVLQLSGRHYSVLLVFARSQAKPLCVAKIAQSDSGRELLRKEAAALGIIGGQATKIGAPDLLLHVDGARSALVLQSALDGTPFADELAPGDRNELMAQFRAIVPWLIGFQSRIPNSACLRDETRAAVARCRRTLAITPAEETLLRAAEEMAEEYPSLPAVAVHGDFWAGNVLRRREDIAVIDWVDFHFGAPTEDLNNFVAATCYRRSVKVEDSAASVWNSFFCSSPVGRHGLGGTLALLKHHRLPMEALRPMFVHFLTARLGATHFRDHAVWRSFITRYMAEGMPEPFGGIALKTMFAVD
jgi:hypothetical protein